LSRTEHDTEQEELTREQMQKTQELTSKIDKAVLHNRDSYEIEARTEHDTEQEELTREQDRKISDIEKIRSERETKQTEIKHIDTLLESIARNSEILPGSNNDIRFRIGDVIRETDIRRLAMDEVRNSSMDSIISNVTRYGAIPDTGYALRYSEAQARAGASGVTAGKIEIDYERLGEVVGQRVAEEMKNLQVWLSLTELRDAQDNVVHLDELTRQ